MSRKILAADAGLSERYLAQLEGGAGNASIIVLRQIARALDMALADLVSEAPDRPVEARLLLQLLEGLSGPELTRARALLQAEFAKAQGDERGERIALIGLRGAGKSTLGRRLAARLGVPFVELDAVIREEYGAELSEIFALYGQPGFRRYERRCLEQVIERHPRAVIATGGGLVAEPTTFDRLLSACYTVWLRATPEEHMQRVIDQGDLRPMADNSEAMDDLRKILAVRSPFYAKADAEVSTAGRSVDEAFADLVAALPDRVIAAAE